VSFCMVHCQRLEKNGFPPPPLFNESSFVPSSVEGALGHPSFDLLPPYRTLSDVIRDGDVMVVTLSSCR